MTDTSQYKTNTKINIGGKISAKLPCFQENPIDTDSIPKGDMPEEKVVIGPDNMKKSQLIFPWLLEYLIPVLNENPFNRAVVAVCGGSGVGKSGISSMLSYYLNNMNIGSYTLSGDNYPCRIPKYNDAERLRIFREKGIKGLIANGQYSKEKDLIIRELQRKDDDANSAHVEKFPWLLIYQSEGYSGLKNYIGTINEINFDELTEIISQFKNGKHKIFLK
jgi:alpha-galactosidase